MQVLNAYKYKIFNDPMIVRVLFIFICNINKIDIQNAFPIYNVLNMSILFLYLHIANFKEIKLIYTLDS